MPRNALAAAILLGGLISACGSALSLTHTETPCVTPGGTVTLHTTTYPLDAINDAMADLDGGRLQGRGILIPGAA